MKAFHAYDIRGVYEVDFNKNEVYSIGYAIPEVLEARKVLVGRDVRNSSVEIHDFLIRGLMDAGADVYDAGLATTPMVYWSTAKYDFDASVMITASHNPKEYNGLKVSGKNALPVGYDNGLNKIEAILQEGKVLHPNKEPGKYQKFNTRQDYLAFLKSYNHKFPNLDLAIDCSNGMAGLIIEDILGKDHIYLNKEPDGNFPGHDPNPLNPNNVKQLQEEVLSKHCDLGVIFDGDADRVMFVDDKGRFVSPDLIIALLGHHFLEGKEKNQRVLQDIRTSKSVSNYLRQFDAEMFTWKVGRAHAALKLREINGIYGGELAGHYYFRDFYFSDSGMLACLLTLNVVSQFLKQGISFSSLIDTIKTYENSGEINFRIENKSAAMEAVKLYYTDNERHTAFFDFDGYRMEFDAWWFNIRPSNTEPYLRLLVEANTSSLLVEKVQEIESLLKEFE